MQEVEAMRDVYFIVFGLYPCELIYDLIAPFVHTFVAYVHLGI